MTQYKTVHDSDNFSKTVADDVKQADTQTTLQRYPELEMYDENYCLTICPENAAMGFEIYEVVFDVALNERYYCFIHGYDSLLEALGFFFQNHPNITYNMIVAHEEA